MNNQKSKPLVGFIGQGWIGKNYANDFEARGFNTVRYALEDTYKQNKEKILDCDITLIAVPTPTKPEGFDDSILREALKNIGKGRIAVIKSTTIPGTTVKVQMDFPDITILHSPEFLTEKTAAYDASHPNRNIIGIPKDTSEHKKSAELVLSILPKAPYSKIMSSLESELVKYAGNCFLYSKVVFVNILHDLVESSGGNYDTVREAMINDPRIGESHTRPIHTSGHSESELKMERGAGGHCFIKDFEAFRTFYKSQIGVDDSFALLTKMAQCNNNLLKSTNKDLDLLKDVYGEKMDID